ncbi:MAG: hypothetical protein P8N76_26560 [Pirellulaceae bacterium]|nr:hypothetical protein [Pirellulaceae bacterium]
MKRFLLVCIACAATVTLISPNANAIAPFKKAFQKKYVTPSDNESFKDSFKKASCNTCHVKGEKKTVRNSYGDELAKLIDGDANARIKAAGKEGGSAARKSETEKVLQELDKAFDEVAKKKSKSGEAYGDHLKKGELPSK